MTKKKKANSKKSNQTNSQSPKRNGNGNSKKPMVNKVTKASGQSEPKGPGNEDSSKDKAIATDPMGTGGMVSPIVGIGASAGGLDALEKFFRAMPSDFGAAFVLVTHLDAAKKSLLPDILQRSTSMPVKEVDDGVRIEANSIYIIPPNTDLAIGDGVLQLLEPRMSASANLPIDSFLRSLAEAQRDNAISIILSGTGTDGCLGCKSIKGNLGMVMAQEPGTAKFGGMPRRVIDSGLADYVLPPENMPGQLIKYWQLHTKNKDPFAEDKSIQNLTSLQQILTILKTKTSHDFTKYKLNTICRRIERRMIIHQLDEINQYVRFLHETDWEADALFNELLIGVTSFFRDVEAFEHLQSKILPALLAEKDDDSTIRVWVVACASGEEAYSIAILLHEYISQMGRSLKVQIFATDIDSKAIQSARTGIYPGAIAKDVGPERLERYFSKTEDGQFLIRKIIREIVVFAPQNVTSDPPFTKLDLLCCRNLLIYFQPKLQKQLLPVFHYGLNPEGILFLGSSETVGQHLDLFEQTHKKFKFFRKKSAEYTHHTLSFNTPTNVTHQPSTAGENTVSGDKTELDYVEAILRQNETAPCAIINQESNIVYIHGRTGKFLEPSEGKISVNILDMARPGIKAELAAAIRLVSGNRQKEFRKKLQVGYDGQRIQVEMTVTAVHDSNSRDLIMVAFKEVAPTSSLTKARITPSGKSLTEVELELRDTRENMATMVEEMQASNEELKSTNEELQSTNEELQSTNEELETSKEELQSLNEESATVNAELQSRIDELAKTSDDMKNLLDSTDIASIFLDSELRIRNFTPRATNIIPLEKSDSGRLVSDFSTKLVQDTDLTKFAISILEDLAIREQEVSSQNGDTYLLRGRPYRTLANRVDGVVLTFENVTELKEAQRQLSVTGARSEEQFLSVLRACTDGIVLAESDGTIIDANAAFCNFIGYSNAELRTMNATEFTAPEFRETTQSALSKGKSPSGSIPESTSIQKSYVRKDGRLVHGLVTVTWHTDSNTLDRKFSVAFVQELSEIDI